MKHRQKISRHYSDIAVKVHNFRSTRAFDSVTNNAYNQISSYAVDDHLFTLNTV